MPELNWLELGAATAARALLLRALEQAHKPGQRLAEGDDGEALHDFRVALRKLRSSERAYREVLGEAGVPKKLRKRLRRLVRGTGAARDTEVQLALLAGQEKRLRPHQRPGLRWFEQRLQRRLRLENAGLRERVREGFAELARRLEQQLSASRLPGADSFAAALGAAVKTELDALIEGLRSIDAGVDQRGIHEPRLNAKRARYLLAPVAEELHSAAPLIGQLETIQDRLGELHDLEVLGNELRVAAAELAAEQARARIDAVFDGAQQAPRAGRELAGLLALAHWLQVEEQRQLAALEQQLGAGLAGQVEREAQTLLAELAALQGRPAAV
jgi:CHAD domain-containing protein